VDCEGTARVAGVLDFFSCLCVKELDYGLITRLMRGYNAKWLTTYDTPVAYEFNNKD
jgi:hypothetical protein